MKNRKSGIKLSLKLFTLLTALILALSMTLTSCTLLDKIMGKDEDKVPISLDSIPAFDGKNAFVEINNGTPFFEDEDYKTKSYESYSELDSLGRCGVAMAVIGTDIMPTEDRGEIGHVYPSGWEQAKYDSSLVDGGYLYNRCHLIGFQLTGENDNEKNLITGTKFLNNTGMLPFENMIADYIKETDNHVLYRITPIFEGSNLVASGVLMEAASVEDKGEDILVCVYLYNAQPGISIDYKTGKSALSGEAIPEGDNGENPDTGAEVTYILNNSSMKFHKESCGNANDIAEHNKSTYTGERQTLIDMGYSPCGSCKP